MRCDFNNCRETATHSADSGFGHSGWDSGHVCDDHARELVEHHDRFVRPEDVNPLPTPCNGSEVK